MNSGGQLLELATDRFPDLSDREIGIVERASRTSPPLLHIDDRAREAGLEHVVDLPKDDGREGSLGRTMRRMASRSTFATAPKVRAELITWLISAAETKSLVRANWVEVTDCRIEETLRLGLTTAHVTLGLRRVWLKRGMILRHAKLRDLSLTHVRIDPIPPELATSGTVDENGRPLKVAIAAEYASFQGTLAVASSLLCGQLFAPGTNIRGDLELYGSAVFGTIGFSFAQVSGLLTAISLAVRPRPDSLSKIDDRAFSLMLDGVEIGRDLSINKDPSGSYRDCTCLFTGCFYAARVKVGGDLTIDNLMLESGTRSRKKKDLPKRSSGNPKKKPKPPVLIEAWSARIGGQVTLGEALDCKGSIELLDLQCHSFVGDLGGLAEMFGATLGLADARIQNRLKITNAKDKKGENIARQRTKLDLQSAQTRIYQAVKSTWPARGCLSIDGFRYEKLEAAKPAEWKDWIRRDRAFIPSTYDQLASALRAHGQRNIAKRVLEAKEWSRITSDERRSLRGSFWRVSTLYWLLISVRDWIWGTVSGFGYYPWRAIFFIFLLFIVTVQILNFGLRHEIIVPADESGTLGTFNAYAEAFELAIPAIKLGNTDEWTIDPTKGEPLSDLAEYGYNVTEGQLLRWYTWIATGLSWFFGGFLLAAVGGLVRKD